MDSLQDLDTNAFTTLAQWDEFALYVLLICIFISETCWEPCSLFALCVNSHLLLVHWHLLCWCKLYHRCKLLEFICKLFCSRKAQGCSSMFMTSHCFYSYTIYGGTFELFGTKRFNCSDAVSVSTWSFIIVGCWLQRWSWGSTFQPTCEWYSTISSQHV